jgi:hypothetical protein
MIADIFCFLVVLIFLSTVVGLVGMLVMAGFSVLFPDFFRLLERKACEVLEKFFNGEDKHE